MAAKYNKSDQSLCYNFENLHLDSKIRDQDITMCTASNANITGQNDTESTDQILCLCLKCLNFVMGNRDNISCILTGHKCFENSASSAKNINICMHIVIDTISNSDENMIQNHDQSTCDYVWQNITTLESMWGLSSVASLTNEIHMNDIADDEVSFKLRRLITSTPKNTAR